MNGYKAFYNRQQIDVRAETSFKAQCEVARVLRVSAKKQYQITVILCERADESTVVHSPSILPGS